MSSIKTGCYKPKLYVSVNRLAGLWLHKAQSPHCRHCCCHGNMPPSNTASHDNHEKINSWVNFAFLCGYGALLGSTLGHQ